MIGLIRRREMVAGGVSPATVIMTTETNAEVLAVCYAQGWCANADYMTDVEAAAVTSIGTVFRGNTAITHFEEFQYFTSLTSIPGYAFFQCQNLTNLVMPNTITSIGTHCFMQCTKLASVTFSSALQSIDTYGFYSCTALPSISLPSTITTLSDRAFQYCSRITSITVDALTPPIIGSYTFANISMNNYTIYVPSESLEAYQTADVWSNYSSRMVGV